MVEENKMISVNAVESSVKSNVLDDGSKHKSPQGLDGDREEMGYSLH